MHIEGREFGSEKACLASPFHRSAGHTTPGAKPARSCKRRNAKRRASRTDRTESTELCCSSEVAKRTDGFSGRQLAKLVLAYQALAAFGHRAGSLRDTK